MKIKLTSILKNFPMITLWVVIVSTSLSCQDNEDSVLYDDPTVDMSFFNMDSLAKVNVVLVEVGEQVMFYDSAVRSLSDSLGKVTVIIAALNDSIEQGKDEWIPVREQLRADSTTYHDGLLVAQEQDSTYSAQQSAWQRVASNINSGLVLVSEVENQANGRTFNFEDSATAFAIPLNMNKDTSALILTIGNQKYAVGLSYSRIEGADEKGRVTIRAYNLSIAEDIGHDFDSVRVNCRTEDCIDDETTFRFYF